MITWIIINVILLLILIFISFGGYITGETLDHLKLVPKVTYWTCYILLLVITTIGTVHFGI